MAAAEQGPRLSYCSPRLSLLEMAAEGGGEEIEIERDSSDGRERKERIEKEGRREKIKKQRDK